jgi:hypothetical protein
MPVYQKLFERFDAPYERFDNSMLDESFPEELAVASRFWQQSGYAPGISAYLNFFLLKDFIEVHDKAFPPRFSSFWSMARSFNRTDVFVRAVTDSGRQPTGGISNEEVRQKLKSIMRRHERLHIPLWMMSYFGFQLFEAVDHQLKQACAEDQRLHLNYMAQAYRIMGVPFSSDRALMDRFCRDVEDHHAGKSDHLEKHACHILILGEMVGVRSDRRTILPMLPEATRRVFASVHDTVRPGLLLRILCRFAGRALMPRAVGGPRKAIPLGDLTV